MADSGALGYESRVLHEKDQKMCRRWRINAMACGLNQRVDGTHDDEACQWLAKDRCRIILKQKIA